MASFTRAGVRLYYESYGEGPVILLSHGYSATSQMWGGQIAALSARNRLLVWDMRGHGRSDSPEDQAAYSEDETVQDMAALLDEAGAGKAVVGGLSLGGYMSLAFHLKHPDLVRALLVIDAGPGYRKDEGRAGWNANAIKTAERFETEGLKSLQRGSAERATAVHRDAKGLAKAARGMLAQRDSRVIDSLPAIDVPTLVLVGSKDTPFLAAADYMTAKIPQATKVVIPDAGHASNIDQPGAFNEALTKFIQNLGD